MAERRVIVIGAGICGLTATRVLADHFDQVVLLERDRLPDEAAPRNGVPQARHVHGLLKRGATQLNRLFPGLQDELAAEGAPLYDHGGAAFTRVWAGLIPAQEVGVKVQTFSRDRLELALRRRVAELKRVEVRDGSAVAGLHFADGGTGRVDGVLLATGGPGTAAGSAAGAAGEEGHEVLTADLVVDASGRTSRLPDWLAAAGYPAPAKEVVDAQLGYATRVLTAPEHEFHGLQQINRAPDEPKGGYAAQIEGGRWIVTLFGAGRDNHPPSDPDGWLAFSRTLGNPHLDRLIASGTPVGSDVPRFLRTENRRFDYAGMERWPENLVALGDAVTTFNPVYGQGMTVAVIQAVALGDALARHRGTDLTGLSRAVQRQVAKLAQIPWLMSTSEDLIWQHHREGHGRLPLRLRLTNAYKQRLLWLAVNDPDPVILRTFVRVYHMLSSPAAMGSPKILFKVLFKAKSPAPHRP